jgi:hypothetical protein
VAIAANTVGGDQGRLPPDIAQYSFALQID